MFAALPTITTGGGEKTVAKETTTVRDGDAKTTERKVTKQPDGTMREATTGMKIQN
jgi:hypothetical protein